MVASMTGFASDTFDSEIGKLRWEIRSVNHRYIDLSIRLPDFLHDFEKDLREKVQSHVFRGKVEITLRFQAKEGVNGPLTLNHDRTQQLAQVIQSLLAYFPEIRIEAMDVLSWPGIIMQTEWPLEPLNVVLFDTFSRILKMFVADRLREGHSIQIFIEGCLKKMHQEIQAIEQRVPQTLEHIRRKIFGRFEELSLAINKERLEQEMVWIIQKQDIAEELQRLKSHVNEMQRVLTLEGAIGRRLDFLIQEMNRESNTMGGKSVDSQITQSVIEMKVIIEQIREQVQNIE